ncbi:branched-chain amino acid transport system substrate-binding protein [Muricomes intestini]|uniref:Branched-chain amino acid transport system substrate-binding protein n=1 Tax=Muricomes intestini TaxID=1796634 RepID=A0A4R3KGA2_9FIRM|nr:ABC transporter substrate-binding protein [Muricomes intestini]TCS82357.1 branched-chain amino acid transport system substrate-binding protein [Muricomes intestini]
MKRAVSVLLVAALAVSSLAACGSKSASKKEDDKFYIGGIGPTTGGAAIYGTAVKNAAKIAVDEINEDGGIDGHKIEYKFEDDQSDAEKSVNAYNTLKDWGMQVLLGTVTSTPCVAVADKTAQDNMFQVTPSASTTDVLANGNVFQICFTDPNQGTASAQYIAENKLASKVAVIYNSSDVYSSGISDKFIEEAKNEKLDVVATEAFTEDSKTDFSTQLKKAQDSGAELVFLPIYYTEASIILKQADTMGFAPKFFGCDGLDGILSVENFDTSLAEGVMLLTPFAADADDEATQNFVKKYKDEFGEVPNQFAADAYDGIYAIKAALEKAEATPDMSVSDLCDTLKEAMSGVTIQGLTGGDEGLNWEPTGEVNKQPKAVIIKDGTYTAM